MRGRFLSWRLQLETDLLLLQLSSSGLATTAFTRPSSSPSCSPSTPLSQPGSAPPPSPSRRILLSSRLRFLPVGTFLLPLLLRAFTDFPARSWINGILSTIVSLLILFRSLDGSSPTVATLRHYFPFLPLPPAISLSHPSRATNTMNPKATMSKFEEPPKYGNAAGGFGRGGASSPIMEERKTPRPLSPTQSIGGGEGQDKAWYGLGVTDGGATEQGLHVVLEMQQHAPTMRYAPTSPLPATPSNLRVETRPEETDTEPEFDDFEEPPRGGGMYEAGGHSDEHLDLPYQETRHARFADEDESEGEEAPAEMRARQDSWAANRNSGLRRDSWE